VRERVFLEVWEYWNVWQILAFAWRLAPLMDVLYILEQTIEFIVSVTSSLIKKDDLGILDPALTAFSIFLHSA
jgi:hypothetical protein